MNIDLQPILTTLLIINFNKNNPTNDLKRINNKKKNASIEFILRFYLFYFEVVVKTSRKFQKKKKNKIKKLVTFLHGVGDKVKPQ